MPFSRLYFGTIRHQRFGAAANSFTHPLAMPYLDLSELDTLLDGRLLRPGWGLLRFRRKDYFGDADQSLDLAVRQAIEARLGFYPEGPVRMLGQVRSFGHCFNPVVFFYCFDRDERLQAVLAQVTNTPWGEQHLYALATDSETAGQTAGQTVKETVKETATKITGTMEKDFHVSPFQPMNRSYQWRAERPSDQVAVTITSMHEDEQVFAASLVLQARSFSRRNLAELSLRFPADSLRVLGLIYAHAFVLWLRRAQYYPHPLTTERAA